MRCSAIFSQRISGDARLSLFLAGGGGVSGVSGEGMPLGLVNILTLIKRRKFDLMRLRT